MDSIKLTFNTPKQKKLKTVYIVEDNTMEQNMLVDFFSKYSDLTVRCFDSGDACIKDVIISKTTPDLILIDYFLDSSNGSSKDGLEVLTKLREISPYSDVIMLTSVDNERIIELARKKGAMGYVIKGASGFEKLDAILQKSYFFAAPPESEI